MALGFSPNFKQLPSTLFNFQNTSFNHLELLNLEEPSFPTGLLQRLVRLFSLGTHGVRELKPLRLTRPEVQGGRQLTRSHIELCRAQPFPVSLEVSAAAVVTLGLSLLFREQPVATK
jgi:hypothetical protein